MVEVHLSPFPMVTLSQGARLVVERVTRYMERGAYFVNASSFPEIKHITINRTYGSGYPGIGGRGVVGRPFPFWFWPVVWSSNASQIQPYLDGTEVSTSHHSFFFSFHPTL